MSAKNLTHWKFVDDRYLLHTDGTLTAFAEIPGYDIYMKEEGAAANYFSNLQNLLHELPANISLEFRLKRRRDKSSPQKYRAVPIARANDILSELRESYISHMQDHCYSNSIYLIIQIHRKHSVLDFCQALTPGGINRIYKNALAQQEELAGYCKLLSAKLPQLRFMDDSECIALMYELANCRSCAKVPDTRHGIDSLMLPHGKEQQGFYHINGVTSKSCLVYFYPDPNRRLFTDLFAWLPLEMDLSLFLRRLDYGSLLRKSGAEEVKQGRQVAEADATGEMRLREIAEWRRYVVNNNLHIFANVFFIKLYGSEQDINYYVNQLNENLASLGGIMESERLLNFSHFYSLPGNLYRSSFMRHDHTEMVLSLLPTVKFQQGNGYEEAFLGSDFTFKGLSFSNDLGGEFYHSMSVAKTGGGKGVLSCSRIIQLYGLGYDFYVIEVGNTYEFLFKILGGNYATLDPDVTVINPFPPYAELKRGFTTALVTPTIRSLAKILTDGKIDLSIHQISVCEMAFKQLYAKPPKSAKHTAPNLSDFYDAMAKLPASKLNDKQKRSRDEVLLNLKSFLGTIVGERFKHQNNLTISDGLFGADFKLLKDDAHLMVIYLTFLSLRFGQKALLQQTPTFITIDELHEFIRSDKETIRTLCTQIARMGRKERGYINLITQEADDIKRLDASLINQMHIVNLLYTESNHASLQSSLASLNDQAFNTWQGYELGKSDYRPAMVGFGDQWFDTFLSYPQDILALADSSSEAREIKRNILASTQDPRAAYAMLLEEYQHHVEKRAS